MCGLTFTAILNVPCKTLDWLLGWILGTKLFSPELHKSVISSMFIHKFIQKCQYYYTLSDRSVPLVTVTDLPLIVENIIMVDP